MTPLTQKFLTLGNAYHLPGNWLTDRPHLFSSTIVDLPKHQADIITTTIHNIQQVAATPAFQTAALSIAPAFAQKTPGNSGVLFGYDFHLTPDGPKLIEINTNAAGAFLIALLEQAQGIPNALKNWHTRLMQMFLNEWRNKYPDKPLTSIAIIDSNPEAQYFYPEFLLFQALFHANNIACVIADPSELVLKNKKIHIENTPIDLVYNRLTDFELLQPAHAVLQQAYMNDQVMITPNPYNYFLYAHKRNLTLLSDQDLLQRCGISEKMIQELNAVVPAAYIVDPAHAEKIWETRKQFFFKPVSGYAGKGVYRGQNMTRRVFDEILAGNYMAQALVPPSEIEVDGERRKVDLRAYVYAGEILGFGARIYQGQTTNLRTPGGGFAVVRIT